MPIDDPDNSLSTVGFDHQRQDAVRISQRKLACAEAVMPMGRSHGYNQKSYAAKGQKQEESNG